MNKWEEYRRERFGSGVPLAGELPGLPSRLPEREIREIWPPVSRMSLLIVGLGGEPIAQADEQPNHPGAFAFPAGVARRVEPPIGVTIDPIYRVQTVQPDMPTIQAMGAKLAEAQFSWLDPSLNPSWLDQSLEPSERYERFAPDISEPISDRISGRALAEAQFLSADPAANAHNIHNLIEALGDPPSMADGLAAFVAKLIGGGLLAWLGLGA